jgi:hypothetical protein
LLRPQTVEELQEIREDEADVAGGVEGVERGIAVADAVVSGAAVVVGAEVEETAVVACPVVVPEPVDGAAVVVGAEVEETAVVWGSVVTGGGAAVQ